MTFKINRLVQHKVFSKGAHILIVKIITPDKENPENTLYQCRYFSNNLFNTTEFYGFELTPIE